METIRLGIPGFDHVELIGRGGSSRVYRARQMGFDREVALKVLNAGDDHEVLRRFDRERRAMGRLSLNDGIVPVYESGLTGLGEPYLVMPYYAAGSLADRMAAGPIRWQEAVDHLTLAARTMAAAHEADVVHLDLKPANILVSAEGSPRIADFGIAKLLSDQTASRTTGAAFTPAYSAPEILMSGEVSPAADVYGLGATLWALLAGRPPFRSVDGDNSLLAIAGRVIHQPPDDLRSIVPAPICDVIDKAMAKNPADRQPTAGAFARALMAARKAAERENESRPNRLGAVPPAYASAVPHGEVTPDTDGQFQFDEPVPPRFVPAVAPSGVDDALNRFGPLAAFVGSLVILLGALYFVATQGGDNAAEAPTTSISQLSPTGLSIDETASAGPATSISGLDPAGPATSDAVPTPAFGAPPVPPSSTTTSSIIAAPLSPMPSPTSTTTSTTVSSSMSTTAATARTTTTQAPASSTTTTTQATTSTVRPTTSTTKPTTTTEATAPDPTDPPEEAALASAESTTRG